MVRDKYVTKEDCLLVGRLDNEGVYIKKHSYIIYKATMFIFKADGAHILDNNDKENVILDFGKGILNEGVIQNGTVQ